MSTFKAFLCLLFFLYAAIDMTQKAQHNTKGLILDQVIHLSPHQACIFYGVMAFGSGFLLFGAILRLFGVGKDQEPPAILRSREYRTLRPILFIIGVAALIAGFILKQLPSRHYAPTPNEPPPQVLDESALHGTSDTQFGKNWVSVDGKILQGILQANAAPNAEVAILYADGGKDIPASKLPQGFLDDWQLTPQRLRAANNR